MSNISKVILQLLRSADIINDSTSEISQHFGGENHPKLPQPEDLMVGEVALNIAKDKEVISIKNSEGKIVYLPFNLAQRMLQAEDNISDLSGNTEEEIAELIELISSVSGDLESAIETLSDETESSIENLDDKITGMSGVVDSISADTYAYIDDSIEALSYHTDSELSDLHDELVTVSGNIESDLSGAVESLENEINTQVEALSGKIGSVSAATSELFSSISAETSSGLTELEEKLETFSGSIETELHEEVSAINETISGLSSYTESGLQQLQTELDELPLSGLSDVRLTETGEVYQQLDKNGTYSNCFVQTKTDKLSFLLNGPWAPNSSSLVFDIIECEQLIERNLLGIENGKAYKIKANSSRSTAYMADNLFDDNRIECVEHPLLSAQWILIPTENQNCYYIKNRGTNRYIQGYSSVEEIVKMGDNPVEYQIETFNGIDGRYYFAVTTVSPHDFSQGTIGLNLHAESYEDDCYVQAYDAVAIGNPRSQWILEEVPDYVDMPDKDYPITAQTHNGDITNISYVDTYGQIVEVAMPSNTVCDSFDQQITITVPVSHDGSIGNKVSLNFGYGDSMKYIYIPDAPSNLEVLIYRGAGGAGRHCDKYKGHDNVWTFPNGTGSNFDYIALYLPVEEGNDTSTPDVIDDTSTPGGIIDDTSAPGASTPGEIIDDISTPGPSTPAGGEIVEPSVNSYPESSEVNELTVKICGAYSPTALDNITLCYEAGINEDTILTDENPLIYYEVLGDDGNTWENQIIKLASKNDYGIVKAGNNINIHNGTISINIDSQPTNGSNNTISSNAVYQLKESLLTDISNLTDNVSGNISSLSAKVDSDIEALYEHVNNNDEALSGLIESLSATTDTLVDTVSGDLKTYIDTQDESLNGTISGLSSETKSAISDVYVDMAAVSGQIESDLSGEASRLDDKIETVSGNLKSYIDLQDVALNDKIDSLSSTTDNIIGSLSSTTDNIIESLSAKTDSLISGVTFDLQSVSGNIESDLSGAVQTLENEIETQVEAISGRINSLSSTTSGLVSTLSAETSSGLENLDNKIESLSSSTLSGLDDLYDKLVSVSGDIETDIANEINGVNLTIDNLSAYTVNELESLQSQLEELPLSGLSDVEIRNIITGRYDFMEVITKSGNTWTNKFINYATDENFGVVMLGDYIKLIDTKINVDLPMSGITDVELKSLVAPKGASVFLEVLVNSGNTWVNSGITDASTDVFGLVKVGSNINISGGVISIDIDSEPSEGSRNPISSDAVYYAIGDLDRQVRQDISNINTTISGMSGSVDSQISEIYSYIDSGSSEENTLIYALSSETYELVSTTSGDLKTYIDTQDGMLDEKIDSLSSTTDNIIESLSSTTDSLLSGLTSELESVSGNIESEIDALSDIIDTISGVVEDHSSSISDILDDIVALSGADYILETRIRAEQDFRIADVQNLQGRIYAIEQVVPTAATSSNTLTTVNWVNRKIGDAKTELQETIDSLSGSVSSGLTSVTNYVDEKVGDLSGETLGLVGDLSAHTENELDYLNEKIDNLPLSGLSDVEITDESGDYYLDKQQAQYNCYIQTKTDEIRFVFSGDWAPTSSSLVWSIVDYQEISEFQHNPLPDTERGVTAVTMGGYIKEINYIGVNGETVGCAMPTTQICNQFYDEFTVTAEVATSLSDIDSKKVSLDRGFGVTMKYVYIPDAPSDSQIFIMIGTSPSPCRRYLGYSNVWSLPEPMSNYYYLIIYSPETSEPISVDCTILGDPLEGYSMINLCYRSEIYDDTVLTDDDPTMQYEVLSKYGDLWTNRTIGLASKNGYGLMKAGSHINIDNGVISVTLDNKPISGSTNPIESNAAYNAIKEITLYDTLKEPVDGYLRNVHYELNEFSASSINYYTNNIIREARADQPLPVKFDTPGDTLKIYENPTRNGGVYREYNVSGVSEVEIYNLIPGNRYFYHFDTLPTASTPLDTFKLKKTRRFLKVDSIKNVRDLGGIPTEDGGYIAYDKIFRGSELVGKKVQITTEDTDLLKSLGINYDLDLRNGSEVTDASPLDYYKRISFIQFKDIETLTNEEKSKIKEAFETVANNVLAGVKTYIHCVYGFHRAGFLSTLIEGVLGVKQCEIDKDYELSSFADFNGESAKRNDNNYTTGILALNDQYSGSWTRLALECGISEKLIKDFRNAMIVDENRQNIDAEYYEVTYEELVELRDSSKLIPGALYRMIDFETADGVISENASCSPIPDLPDFKSAKHKFDLVLRAISKDKLDSNVKALNSIRDQEGFFRYRDLAKWDLKYDLDNNREKYSWALNNLVEIGSLRTDLELIECTSNELDVDVYYKFKNLDDYIIVKIPKHSTVGSIIANSGIGFIPGTDGIKVTVRSDEFVSLEPEPQGFESLTMLFSKTNTEKYYLDPRYEWLKGKGVVYYMKDEFGNELPYDFQNILFDYEGFDVPTFARLEITNPVDMSTSSLPYIEGYYDTKFTHTLVRGQQNIELFYVNEECDINIKFSGDSDFVIYASYFEGQREMSKTLFDSTLGEYDHSDTIPGNSWVYCTVVQFDNGADFEISIPNTTTVSVHDGANNNVIKPWVTEGIMNLNRNLFVCSSRDNYVSENFTDYNSHDNIVKCDAINCKIGKYCEENELVDGECCTLGDDCVRIKSNHANGLHVGNKCHDITLTQSNGVQYTLVDDMVYNVTSGLTNTYNHIRNEWEIDGRATLTNEEMDLALGGELPVYLMDQNGDMVLDEDGELIEII